MRLSTPKAFFLTQRRWPRVSCRLPLPPGAALSLWKNPALFRKLYFSKFPVSHRTPPPSGKVPGAGLISARSFPQGYYDTTDAGFADEEGFFHVTCRSDDVINVAGHRLSSGALEEVRALASAG